MLGDKTVEQVPLFPYKMAFSLLRAFFVLLYHGNYKILIHSRQRKSTDTETKYTLKLIKWPSVRIISFENSDKFAKIYLTIQPHFSHGLNSYRP